MAVDQQAATANIRAVAYDGAVKQIAKRLYKFKQAVSVISSSAWKGYFVRESSTPLTGATSTGITTTRMKDIPRGAAFPHAVVEWERVIATTKKYGLEQNIPFEDVLSDYIDVKDRTIYKIAEGVAKSVDDEIWSGITEAGTPTNIQTFTIAASYGWNQTSANIIDDLMQAKQLIGEYNYDTSNLMCFISPKQHRYVVAWLAAKGAQFPSIGTDVATNGEAGNLAGIKLIVSNSVTASRALVCVPKICATWKETYPLTTEVIEDKMKSLTIRSCEMGRVELTDPKAIVYIKNTEGA